MLDTVLVVLHWWCCPGNRVEKDWVRIFHLLQPLSFSHHSFFLFQVMEKCITWDYILFIYLTLLIGSQICRKGAKIRNDASRCQGEDSSWVVVDASVVSSPTDINVMIVSIQ